MATPPRVRAIAIPFLLVGLICGLYTFALFSCGGGGAGSGELRNWSAAISLDNSSSVQIGSDVAVDNNGNAIAVWFQSDESGTFHVWATRYVPGQGWGPPGPIQTQAAVATGCQVAMDPNGNAIVTWVQVDVLTGIAMNVWAARYRIGTGWEAPILIGNDNAIIVENPRVAMDRNGNALAVWDQLDLTQPINTRTLWANRYTRGIGWGTPELAGPNTGGSSTGDVAMDPMGNGIVVWTQNEAVDNVLYARIWANRYGAGGWEIPSPIEEPFAVTAGEADVAMDAEGNATATWVRFDGATPPRICSNRYEYGTGWGVAGLTISDNTQINSNPVVSMDPAGTGMAMWVSIDNTGAPDSIWAKRHEVRSGWGSPQGIGANGLAEFQFGMDASGNGIVAWTQPGFPAGTVWTNRFVPGAGWSTPSKIDTGAEYSIWGIRLAVSASGDAFAVWQQSEPNGATHIYTARYGTSVR